MSEDVIRAVIGTRLLADFSIPIRSGVTAQSGHAGLSAERGAMVTERLRQLRQARQRATVESRSYLVGR